MKSDTSLSSACVLVTILIISILHFMDPFIRFIYYPWNLIGTIPLAFGIVMKLTADHMFRKNVSSVNTNELITNGIYGRTRNPMYLGFILILIGTSMLLGSLIPFLVCLAFIHFIYTEYIRIEERILENTFGESWNNYKKNVRRWI